MKTIFNTPDGQIEEEKLMAIVNSSEKEEKLDRDQIKDIMEDLIHDLGGELTVGDAGELVYHFEVLKREMDEIKQIRSSKDGSQDLGKVVFDTEKD